MFVYVPNIVLNCSFSKHQPTYITNTLDNSHTTFCFCSGGSNMCICSPNHELTLLRPLSHPNEISYYNNLILSSTLIVLGVIP